jgi:hypothetical protein
MTFPSRPEYERLLYTLPQVYPEISVSTLRFHTTSATTGVIKGSVYFRHGFELRVVEVIDFAVGEILNYSYTVFRSGEKIRWYDPQPHPKDHKLSSTFLHHYHNLPNLKHNRQPAPGISFASPNLPTLIADVLGISWLP